MNIYVKRKIYLHLFVIINIIFISLNLNKAYAYPADGDWIPIRRNNIIIQDDNNDAQGSRNIVSSLPDYAAGYFYNDGINIYFRIRLDDDPSGKGGQRAYKPYGWGFELDTNGNAGDYEWLIMLNGIDKVENLSLRQNTVQGTLGDPSDNSEIDSLSYTPVTDYSRVVAADSSINGDQDYFLDFFLPYSDLLAATGLTDSSPIRFFEGSSSSTNSLTERGADLVGASDLYSGFSDYYTLDGGYIGPVGAVVTTGTVKFVQALDGSGDVTQITVGDTIYLAVNDNDQNLDSTVLDTVSVTLTSGNGDTETLTLTETVIDTGIFTVSISSALGTAVNEDGTLQIAYGDTLTATYVDKIDADLKINQSRTDTCAVAEPIIADLSISKAANNSTFNEGNNVTYTITLTNNGAADATGIQITDQLPSGITYVSDTPGQGNYDSGTGVWNVGILSNGNNATLTITATVDTGTGGSVITNSASITALDQNDPDNTNDSDSVDITVVGTTGTITSTTPIVPGDVVTITVTDADLNTDSGVAETFQLTTTNSVTGETELLTYTETGIDTRVFTSTVNTVYGITAGTNDDGTFVVKRGDTLVTEYNDALTDTGASATVSATTTVQQPVMTISKTVDKTTAVPDEILTYTITYENIGDGNAREVYFIDNIPENTTYVIGSASGTGTAITFQHVNGGVFDSSETAPIIAVMWTLSNPLPPGETGSLTIQTRIK